MAESPDILIVGGGPVGATLALLLRESGFAVTVLESRLPGAKNSDPRALALSEGSRQLLHRLGVWSALQAMSTPIETIHVSQRGSLGRTVLHAADIGQPALGYVLPYAGLSQALDEALQHADVKVWHGCRAEAVESAPDAAMVRFSRDDRTQELSTRLLVLADGGRSPVSIPGLQRTVHDYGQSALVGLVTSDQAHGCVAYERFTPQGPVALLPDGEDTFALVWTMTPNEAETLGVLPEVDFLLRLQAHFGERAGCFVAVCDRATFPLKLSYVRPVTAPHLVVIGNAAQTLHPVAGQGFNLGLRDAWELGLMIHSCTAADLGGAAMLETYRRRRRYDTMGGMRFTDFLVRAFSNDIPGLGFLRGTGLGLLELLPPARRFVARRMSFGANG